jgi:4-amino-4-deoxy-L-arabinose transferase-like glycosyltransferase
MAVSSPVRGRQVRARRWCAAWSAPVFDLARVAEDPLNGDPAMYATIARTIARTGEWTHLTFNGDPYLNKPPLYF